MNFWIKVVVIVLILASLGLFAVTYKVRFNEAAVETWFGKASPESTKREPGLYWKAPYPFSTVIKYDTRARYLGAAVEQVTTADSRPVAVEAFVVWRVADPARFYERYFNAGQRAEQQFEKAEETLRNYLRSSLGAISQYRFDQLFATGESKLPQLESDILTAVRGGQEGGASLASLGIEVVSVGISAIEFPSQTTSVVFERMKEDRKRLVQDYQSRGESRATEIRSRAEANAEIIRHFATLRADSIRARGDREAGRWFREMQEAPELAVWLQQIALLKDVIFKQATVVVSPEELGMTTGANSLMASLLRNKLLNVDEVAQRPPASNEEDRP